MHRGVSMKSLRFLAPLLIFLVVGAFLAVGLKLDPREVPSPLIDKPAPQFALPRLLQVEGLVPQVVVGVLQYGCLLTLSLEKFPTFTNVHQVTSGVSTGGL